MITHTHTHTHTRQLHISRLVFFLVGNLTSMFFPGLHHTMRREVRQLMRGLVEVSDLGDDDEDELDESDAELVDGM